MIYNKIKEAAEKAGVDLNSLKLNPDDIKIEFDKQTPGEITGRVSISIKKHPYTKADLRNFIDYLSSNSKPAYQSDLAKALNMDPEIIAKMVDDISKADMVSSENKYGKPLITPNKKEIDKYRTLLDKLS